jgi:hypothetical protein
MIPTLSPRPWRSRASCSGGLSGRTGPSKKAPSCQRTWAGHDARRPGRVRATSSATKHPPRKSDDKADRKAALAFEREQARRDSERRKEEAAREKERERRAKAVAKAQAALDNARREHEQKADAIEAERAALDERAQAEETRWEKQREKLDAVLRRARTSRSGPERSCGRVRCLQAWHLTSEEAPLVILRRIWRSMWREGWCAVVARAGRSREVCSWRHISWPDRAAAGV